ncbi:hypothetical protein [Furfurilactobacillus curtus]|uniref:Uncharacterized protein n=1 Tax=Furfurilactobacillus curtus TaxID=1746200 RepID=A0ABQ5JNJ2_9LACO
MTTNENATTWDLNFSFYDYIHLSDMFYTFFKLPDKTAAGFKLTSDIYNPVAQILLISEYLDISSIDKSGDYETFKHLRDYFQYLFNYPKKREFPAQVFFTSLAQILQDNNLHPTIQNMQKDFLNVTYRQMSSSFKPFANAVETAIQQIQ